MGRSVLVLSFGLLALACGARAGRGASPDHRALGRLERQAQQEMNCRAVHVVPLAAVAYQVDGCGQMREYAYVCPGRRCQFQPIIPAVMRASADLQCAPEMLTSQADSATHRAFFGCNSGIAYSLLCVDHGCTWARTQEQVTIASAGPVGVTTAPVSDPTLEAAVIPPPPGAAPAPTPATVDVPPPPGAAPPPPASTVVVPPPPGAVPPPPASTTLTPSSPAVETVVIPPPPR